MSHFRLTVQIYEFILISKSPNIHKFTLKARKYAKKQVFIGEYIDVAVTKVDDEKKQIGLSKKRVLEIPMEHALNELKSLIEPGQIVEATIVDVFRTHANVQINGTDVIIQLDRNHLTRDKVVDAREVLYPGEVIHLVYLGYVDGQLVFDRKILTSSNYPKEIYDLSLEQLLLNQQIDCNLFVGRAVRMNGAYSQLASAKLLICLKKTFLGESLFSFFLGLRFNLC